MKRWLWLLAIVLAGCHEGSADLPVFSTMDADTARAILVERAQKILSMSAQCQVTLDRGQAVRLDGVMVLALPGRLRLRVWKLNQPVFDLTVRDDGVWIESQRDVPAVGAEQLAKVLTLIEGGLFASPELTVQPADGEFVFRLNQPDGAAIVCHVDRATALAKEFDLLDPQGQVRFTLAMSDYREFKGKVWPVRMDAVEEGKDGGKISVKFSDIEFNGEVAEGAFVPPADAVRLK